MKENSTERKPFTKSRLIKELSWTCELPQTKIKAILEALAEIARREARNTLVLPGICKLEVVRRKPRKVRNPRTGETFMLPERDALRITAPRSLKLACARVVEQQPAAPEQPAAQEQSAPVAPPAVEQPPATTEPATEPVTEPAVEQPGTAAPETVTPQPETAAPQPEPEAPRPEPEATPQPPVDPDALISFRCPRCKQEVEATGDMVGFETECPTCGNPIKVPAQSEPGTIHGAPAEGGAGADGDAPVRHAQTVSSHEAESISPEKLKGLTIRIDVDALGLGGQQKTEDEPPPEQMVSFVCIACKQEIEASRDMIGETTACPNCGAPIVVPAESTSNTLHGSPTADPKAIQAMKGRTMRIDMGEDF